MICNFSKLLISDMNGTNVLYTAFKKKLLSYCFIETINLPHSPKSDRKNLLFNRGY